MAETSANLKLEIRRTTQTDTDFIEVPIFSWGGLNQSRNFSEYQQTDADTAEALAMRRNLTGRDWSSSFQMKLDGSSEADAVRDLIYTIDEDDCAVAVFRYTSDRTNASNYTQGEIAISSITETPNPGSDPELSVEFSGNKKVTRNTV